MIGQEQIVKTLVNQIESGRVGHAYLFSGARGTGKTTAAKIFARAINCQHPVNGSPCGECEACKKLADPSNLDILEIDAASNNKVDNAREIRDKIQYPPVAGRYKVYIIDEAHMLTTEAFNALLKTLEEPPKHAVIIMATTEPHKLPTTILSRCMRFDFKLVSEKRIAELIGGIYDELGKPYEREALTAIARAGAGSVRDALSIADTCVSYTNGTLTYKDVSEVLGSADNSKTLALTRSVLEGDVGATLKDVDELISLGKSVSLLLKDVSATLRDLLIVKTCADPSGVLNAPEEELARLKEIAEIRDAHGIFRAIEIFAGIETELKYSTNARVVFETAAVKAAMPSADYNIDALLSRIDKLERALESGAAFCQKSADKPVIEQKTEIKEESPVVKQDEKSDRWAEKEPENNDKLPRGTSFGAAYEEYMADVNEDDAPKEEVVPVENQIGIDVDSFVQAKGGGVVEYGDREKKSVEPTIPEKKESAPASAEETVKPKFSDGRIWGTVLRRLRADKNIMLWIACQDQDAKTVDGEFRVIVGGENEYNMISKAESVATLESIVSEMTDAKVVVVRRGDQGPDELERGVEKAKEIFGDIEIKN